MCSRSGPAFVRHFLVATCVLLALAAGGCAGLATRDPVRIGVVGLEPLPGRGLEMRFDLQLRLQNPNDTPLEYDGIAIELELNGKPFATGVSNQKGTVPRFGETVFGVPVSVSAVAAVRQAFGMVESDHFDNLPYVLRGKLGGGAFGTRRFTDRGSLSLPGTERGGGGS